VNKVMNTIKVIVNMKTLMIMMMALVLSSPVWADITVDEFLARIEVQATQTKNNLIKQGSETDEATFVGIYSAVQWIVVIHERFEEESPSCNNLYDIGTGSVANRGATKDMYQHAMRYLPATKQMMIDYLCWTPSDFASVDKGMRDITTQALCTSI